MSLVEASDKILGAFDERMIKYAHSVLSERGVKIQTGSAVTEVTSEYVEMKVRAAPSITSDGKVTPSSDPPTVVRVPYGSLVWAGGITSRPITKSIASNIGMPCKIKLSPLHIMIAVQLFKPSNILYNSMRMIFGCMHILFLITLLI